MAPVKNLPANAGDTGDAKTQVYFLRKEDPLEKETATHSSILALEVDRGARWVIVHGVPKSQTQMSMHALDHWILSHTHNSVSVIMSPSLSLTLTDLHSSCKHPCDYTGIPSRLSSSQSPNHMYKSPLDPRR